MKGVNPSYKLLDFRGRNWKRNENPRLLNALVLARFDLGFWRQNFWRENLLLSLGSNLMMQDGERTRARFGDLHSNKKPQKYIDFFFYSWAKKICGFASISIVTHDVGFRDFSRAKNRYQINWASKKGFLKK